MLYAGKLEPTKPVNYGPSGPCKRGHVGFWKDRGDQGGWRCTECQSIENRRRREAQRATA